MGSIQRALEEVGGALAEYGDMEIKAQIAERHSRRMAEIKNKYASETRADNQKYQLARDTQAQKERYRISEYEVGMAKEAADVKHERGVAAKDKQYAHEMEKEKLRAAGKGAKGPSSARIGMTNQVWENLKKIRPDDDPTELWLEAFKLSNEKKELSPEADIREMWKSVYNEAKSDPLFPKSDEEARELADEAEETYQKKMYPDFSADRKRFKKNRRNGKAIADMNRGNERAIRNGKALGTMKGVDKDAVAKGKAMGVMEAPDAGEEARKNRLRSLY